MIMRTIYLGLATLCIVAHISRAQVFPEGFLQQIQPQDTPREQFQTRISPQDTPREQSQTRTSPQDYLEPHNKARASKGLPPLEWDSTLESYARNYARQRASDCMLEHSNGPYGENIYFGSGSGYNTARDAVQWWLDEEKFYNYDANSCESSQSCLHYTQIVWRGTTRIGCADAVCSNGNTFITCNYDPPGNVIGERPY